MMPLSLFAPPAVAHGPHGHGNRGAIRDHVAARQGKQLLSLRMVPSRKPAETDSDHPRQVDGVYQARVGQMSFFVAELTSAGKPAADVIYTLNFEQLEGGTQVCSTTAFAPDGRMRWGQQLFDGSEHRVSVTATSRDGAFAPMTAQMTVGVQAVQPPGHIVARILSLLIGVVAVAMTIGYCGTHYLTRQAPVTASENAVEVSGA